MRWIHDPFGNSIAIATFAGETRSLELTSTIRLEHFALPLELPPIEEYARKLPFGYLAEEAPDLARYVERHYPDPNAIVSSWTKQFLEGEGGAETFAALTRMCKGIQEGLNVRHALRARHAAAGGDAGERDRHLPRLRLLMMEGAARVGLAARFVTGYLYDPALDEAPVDARPAFPHAWMEVYLPGAGWVEFDPTNGIIGTERLIRVAVGRDPEQAMPIKGTFTGAADVAVQAVVDVQVRALRRPQRTSRRRRSDSVHEEPEYATACSLWRAFADNFR